MEKVCVICNNIIPLNIKCNNCGGDMNNIGRIQEFRDAYGNAEEIEDDEKCIHYFQCCKCKAYKKVIGNEIYI